MKKPFALLLAAAFGASLLPANTADSYETTQEMMAYCDGTSELGVGGEDFCTGYISGILDTVALERELNATPFFCLPTDGVTVNEALVVLESYARRNPAEYSEDFLGTFYLAMEEKYPCY